MRIPYFIRQLHLWLGLLLGAQVLLWMASGVVMSWFHITLVRGETSAPARYAIELEARSFANPGGIVAQAPGASEISLKYFQDRFVYVATSAAGKTIFDAQTGEKLSPPDEKTVRAIAKREFIGDGEIERLELMTAPPHEYAGERPVWRASFSDRLETRLYISPGTGEVMARRNGIWRLYDFFWMLHIMDYDDRENFNNPLLRAFSATGLLFAITGIILVVMRFSRGGYRFKRLKEDDLREALRTGEKIDGHIVVGGKD